MSIESISVNYSTSTSTSTKMVGFSKIITPNLKGYTTKFNTFFELIQNHNIDGSSDFENVVKNCTKVVNNKLEMVIRQMNKVTFDEVSINDFQTIAQSTYFGLDHENSKIEKLIQTTTSEIQIMGYYKKMVAEFKDVVKVITGFSNLIVGVITNNIQTIETFKSKNPAIDTDGYVVMIKKCMESTSSGIEEIKTVEREEPVATSTDDSLLEKTRRRLAEIASQKEKVVELETTVIASKSKITQYEIDITNLNNVISELNEKIAQLNATIEQIEIEKNNAINIGQAMKNIQARQKKEIDEYTSRTEERMQKLNAQLVEITAQRDNYKKICENFVA